MKPQSMALKTIVTLLRCAEERLKTENLLGIGIYERTGVQLRERPQGAIAHLDFGHI